MHWRWLAVGFGVLSLGMIVGGVASVQLPPRTYQEAVMQVLDARQIEYDEIVVTDSCPPAPQCYAAWMAPFAAVVSVTGAYPAHGYLTCTVRTNNGDWTRCSLSITELNLRNLPLPALAADPPWLALLRQAWHNRRTITITIIETRSG